MTDLILGSNITVFTVRLRTAAGLGGSAIFSGQRDAEQLVERLNERKRFVENHRDKLRHHEFLHVDLETGESFLFSHIILHTEVELKERILH